MADAGATDTRVIIEHDPLVLRSPEHWWDVVESTGLSQFLSYLDQQSIQAVRTRNLEHIKNSCISELDIAIVYALATKAGDKKLP